MKLIVKFNLVLFLVFAIGFAAVGFFANRLLQRNAKEEIVENARIMMEAALAVRAYTTTQINIQPAIKSGAQGKESGIFSKKQVLILFDLLSTFKDFDKIDYTRPAKFDGYADLLHALTGKSKLSILEELNNYHDKELYKWQTQGELRQLIITLIHLANTFRNAGFRSFAKLLDKKIIELEYYKED